MSQLWWQGATALTYHQVGKFPHGRTRPGIYCDLDAFRRQMRLLAVLRTPIVNLQGVIDAFAGGAPLPRRAVLLTFDDGDIGFLEHAAPILAAHGFPAVIFAVSGLLGQRTGWLEAIGQPPVQLADASDLQRLARGTVTIGAHTQSHARLPTLADDRLRTEIAGSREDLEVILGRPVESFCYPFGDFDDRSVSAGRDAGFKLAFTCKLGRMVPGLTDPMVLPRVGINYNNNLFAFAWKLLFLRKPGLFRAPDRPARQIDT